jgi:hypothetical protein
MIIGIVTVKKMDGATALGKVQETPFDKSTILE